MANYRQIHVSIWKDNWFLELEPAQKLLFIYLFSNSSTSLAGIYEISIKVICFETGLDPQYVIDTLSEFERQEKVFYENGIIWVKNLRRYNASSSDKVAIRIESDLADIPECTIKRRYISYYQPNIPYADGIDTISLKTETLTEALTETKQEKKLTASAISAFNSHFDPTRIYADITGQVAIPSDSIDRVTLDLENIIDTYADEDQAVEDGKAIFAEWCGTKGKSGRFYSKVNPGWLGWWMERRAPEPTGDSGAAKFNLPKPRVICGDGERLHYSAGLQFGRNGYNEAVKDYENHIATCQYCSGASNANDVRAAIGNLVAKMEVKK